MEDDDTFFSVMTERPNLEIQMNLDVQRESVVSESFLESSIHYQNQFLKKKQILMGNDAM